MTGCSHLEYIESRIREKGDIFQRRFRRAPTDRMKRDGAIHSTIEYSSGYTGFVNWVNDHINPQNAVDVCCGYNAFGGENGIRNLTGFDIFQSDDNTVDINKSFTEVVKENIFDEDSVDFVICHGSFRHGTYETIKWQLEQIKRWCKDGTQICIRMSDKSEAKGGIGGLKLSEDFSFNWTPEIIERFGNELGFTITRRIETSTEIMLGEHSNNVKEVIDNSRSTKDIIDLIDKVNNNEIDPPKMYLHVWWWQVNK